MYPVKLIPAFKDYLWGGSKLKTDFGKKSRLSSVAESWELSVHKDGESVVANGKLKGKPLSDCLRSFGSEALGTGCLEGKLPILIKLIDARLELSIQVHPDDAYAAEHENDHGKTELWYVLDCEPGSFLYYGFSKDVSKEEVEAAIANGTLTGLLNKVPVHKGDVFFIPAGTIHGIGAGIVLAEIQQSSNATYRVFDFGRKDASGKERPLHVAKALDVLSYKRTIPGGAKHSVIYSDYTVRELARCPYFTCSFIKNDDVLPLTAKPDSFHAVLCVDGTAEMLFATGERMPIIKGDCVFIPAGYGDYKIEGLCDILLSKV